MRRYIKNIFLLLVTVFAASCVKELELAPSMSDSELTTLVPRVKSFANQYITKADYTGTEKTITSLSVLVFDDNGNLVDTQTGTSTVTINKTMLKKKSVTAATIVMFANISLNDIKDAAGNSINSKTNLTLADVGSYTCHFDPEQAIITSLDNFTGFPMMGTQEGVNLTPTSAQQNAIQVDLKILYAKINFEIAVAAGSENANVHDDAQTFTLTGYSVNNVSTSTPLTAPAAGAATSSTSVYTPEPVTGSASGSVDLNSTQPLKFTFYMAESRYNHNLANLEGIYPDDQWLTEAPEDDVKGYYSLTDEQKALQANKLNGVKYIYDDLIQQYKPKLANVDGATPGKGLATYVTVKGTYTDYRGTPWTVNYKIYLGKDNAQDFHVDRNSEYTNILTIKGIRNNDDHTGTDVWIDHRVDVSTTSKSGNITITRETLIDSHIEVRPLRVKWTGDTYSGARVYLPTDSNNALINWIGIEKFTGENCLESSSYCYAGSQPTGKRKYFTTSLISELQTKSGEFGIETDGGKKFLFLRNGDCAWIYFDENATASERTADIKVEFFDKDGKSKGDEVYKVKQRGLQTVGGYAIESFEEYLHTYDSADKYNLSTSPIDYTQKGLAWGLTNKQISKDIIVSAGPLEIENIGGIQSLVSQRYDFFHSSDVPSGNSYHTYTNVSGSWAKTSYGTGLTFTDRASAHEKITIKDMGTTPSSAYQYCLSKNKFKEDADGNHTLDIHWYLPDVYELGAILAANQSSVDLAADAYYWSSQPSYEGLGIDQIPLIGQYLDDVNIQSEVVTNARAATKGSVTDIARTEKHRIRCLYSEAGKKNVDMSDRAPDGMGGIFNFWMKGWTDGGKNTEGFFNYLLPTPSTSTTSSGYNYPNVNYPTKENSYNVSGAEFSYFVTTDKDDNPVEGFSVNPSTTWKEYEVTFIGTGYYTTLGTYPGLVNEELKKITGGDYTNINAWQPISDTRKSVSESSTSKTVCQLTKSDLPTTDLEPLDHLNGGGMFDISFAIGKGSANPTFIYDELVLQTSTTNTKYWTKPTYEEASYQPKPDKKTITYTATATNTGGKYATVAGYDIGKASAFGNFVLDLGRLGSWTFSDGAYDKAKAAALQGVKDIIAASYSHYSYNYDDATFTDLEWSDGGTGANDNPKYEKLEDSWGSKKYKCTCTVTCTLEISLAGAVTPYFKPPTGAGWSTTPTSSTTSTGPTVNTDQLRIYCGNSFTVSLSDAYKNDYEITKIKVHYSGGNQVNQNSWLSTERVYARFVEGSITLPMTGDGGSSIMGMEYLEDSDAGTGTHQWAGKGTDSVTMVLADYTVKTETDINIDWGNLGNSSLMKYTYTYDEAKKDLSKYIILDRIEVKCTKKATAATE